MTVPTKYAVIIGAGPAGLTAAYELLERTDLVPIVLEKDSCMGGISRTVEHNGNRIDIGGHRFFSKSDRVMNWWQQHLPVEDPDQGASETRMLLRSRKSRIYFLRKLFEYPIRIDEATMRKLGWKRMMRIGLSYTWTAMLPKKPATNLEQFFIQRFGRELYETFFKSYTEKVWGMPCDQISAEWGAQRIKGLSIRKAIAHFMKSRKKQGAGDVAQKKTETSLIDRFLYPKFGPGQMWQEVARKVTARGGQIVTGMNVRGLTVENGRIRAVVAADAQGNEREFRGEVFFSSMPVKELVASLRTDVPPNVREVADGLTYRDFITVGLLLKKLKLTDPGATAKKLIEDNWIYVQEPDVLVGRLQIFNNWSPYMVRDRSQVWLGAEYFCYEGDDLWTRSDAALSKLAAEELAKIGIVEAADVVDSTVIRMPKAYPAYFGSYSRFGELREYLDKFENLWLVGRNGMHKYNNQDHSMLAAMTVVDNLVAGVTSKENIWSINTEEEYHEVKKTGEGEALGETKAAAANA